MNSQLMAQGARLDAVFFCPHTPEDSCDCRKPQPGLLLDIGRRYGVDLRHVPMVGDTLRDLLAAQAAGCEPHLVLSGRAAGLGDDAAARHAAAGARRRACTPAWGPSPTSCWRATTRRFVAGQGWADEAAAGPCARRCSCCGWRSPWCPGASLMLLLSIFVARRAPVLAHDALAAHGDLGRRVICGVQLPRARHAAPAHRGAEQQGRGAGGQAPEHLGDLRLPTSCRTRWPTCSSASCCTSLLRLGHGPAGHDPHRPQQARRGLEQGGRAGQALADQGIWVIMFPEGTRTPRGSQGVYKSGASRLAISQRRAHRADRRQQRQVLAAQELPAAAGRGGRVHRRAHRQRRPASPRS
jgi:hypothetical protein